MVAKTYAHDDHPERKPVEAFNKRLDEIGWALLLILTGTIWLLPHGRLPDGAWLIGAGVIILGLCGVRRYRGIPAGGFAVLAGTLLLVSGLATAFTVELPFFAVLFVLLGIGVLLKPQGHHAPLPH